MKALKALHKIKRLLKGKSKISRFIQIIPNLYISPWKTAVRRATMKLKGITHIVRATKIESEEFEVIISPS